MAGFIFRSICKVAKKCLLALSCQPTCVGHIGSCWTDFHDICIVCTSVIIIQENSDFVQIRQEYTVLHTKSNYVCVVSNTGEEYKRELFLFQCAIFNISFSFTYKSYSKWLGWYVYKGEQRYELATVLHCMYIFCSCHSFCHHKRHVTVTDNAARSETAKTAHGQCSKHLNMWLAFLRYLVCVLTTYKLP